MTLHTYKFSLQQEPTQSVISSSLPIPPVSPSLSSSLSLSPPTPLPQPSIFRFSALGIHTIKDFLEMKKSVYFFRLMAKSDFYFKA